MKKRLEHICLLVFLPLFLPAQEFYFGADLSYVNEMEDCGVTYYENGEAKDPYAIFADHNCGLVRLRLWHTPDWYDELNSGNRYSDLEDVKKSIARAKAEGMAVLLDFHLSDTWADPGRQIAPAAWHGVVDDLPTLSDSLYNYIYGTLLDLYEEDLLPEMVQIGNETNKGILLSPEVDASGWVLDWERNATLFNRGIKAVRDVEIVSQKEMDIVLHIAGPADAPWFFEQFADNGVTDFDIIGLSYYWEWHNEASMDEVGRIITDFQEDYPGKEVMIVETGYPWTSGFNDQAGNNLSRPHPGYQPFSPENQAAWLIRLTEEVLDHDGLGVIYWEPAWVSSSCSTQWGTGSHYEHAAFFDFQNNLLTEGGIRWMTHEYDQLTSTDDPFEAGGFDVSIHQNGGSLYLSTGQVLEGAGFRILSADGKVWEQNKMVSAGSRIEIASWPSGIYIFSVKKGSRIWSRKFFVSKD